MTKGQVTRFNHYNLITTEHETDGKTLQPLNRRFLENREICLKEN